MLEGRPPLYPVACLGKVTSHDQLADGTYNLLFLGVQRVRTSRSCPQRTAFASNWNYLPIAIPLKPRPADQAHASVDRAVAASGSHHARQLSTWCRTFWQGTCRLGS